MKRKMKIPIVLTIALVLALGLAACGGSGGNSGTTAPTSGEDTTETAQGDDTAETQPSPTPEPNDDAAQLSATPIDTPSVDNSITDTLAPEPKDGDLIRVSMGTDNRGEEHISSSIWGFRLSFMGDTTQADKPEVSNVKLYIDGAARDVDANLYDSYLSNSNNTTYDYHFGNDFVRKPAKYYVELTMNGVSLRSNTADWQADGVLSHVEDALIPSPIPSLVSSNASTDPGASSSNTSIPTNQSEQTAVGTGINGTLFDLPEPFEAHDGDKQYFCIGDDERFSDDYIVTMETRDELYDLPGNPVTVYLAAFFDEEGNVISEGSFIKYVFETEVAAEEYCTIDTTFIPVGNVAYQGPMPEGVMRVGLQNPYKEAQITYANNTGATIYLSKP